MERERKAFQVFLSLHQHKAVPIDEPVAYLQFYDECMPSDMQLIKFTRDDILDLGKRGRLDLECELVRVLLQQVSTYDCSTQRVIGLIFNKNTVLSDVLIMPDALVACEPA